MAAAEVKGEAAVSQVVTTKARFENGTIGAMDGAADQKKGRRARRGRRGSSVAALTERDRQVVRWVHLAGLATREQVQKLLFTPGGRSRCQHRLTMLHRRRFLDKLPRRAMNMPDVYFVSRKSVNGLRLLRAAGESDPLSLRSLPAAKLEHSLDIVSCRVQILKACGAMGLALTTWLDEDELAGPMGKWGVVPDAYFQISRPTEVGEKRSGFFLEVERSGKRDRDVLEKFRRYHDYYYGGEFEREFGLKALRVLVLVGADYGLNAARRVLKFAELAARAEVPLMRFATLDGFLALQPHEALNAPIWRRPGSEDLVGLFEVGK